MTRRRGPPPRQEKVEAEIRASLPSEGTGGKAEGQVYVTYNELQEQVKTHFVRAEDRDLIPVDMLEIGTDAYKKMRVASHLFTEIINIEKKRASSNKKNPKSTLTIDDFLVDPSYNPQDPWKKSPTSSPPANVFQRLLICRDLSETNPEHHTLPVYCDLNMESSDFCLSQGFFYANFNCVDDPEVDPKAEVKICCTCEDECPPDTCECLKLQKFACGDKVEYMGGNIIRDSYHYYKNRFSINVDTQALIMCGPLCHCSKEGTCQNNVDRLRSTGRYEIFRRNPLLGFGIRSLNNIAPGEVISEFVGALRSHKVIDSDERFQNYSIEVGSRGLNDLMDRLLKGLGKKDEDLHLYSSKAIKAANRREKSGLPRGQRIPELEWYIDPHAYGNMSRFFSHGCFSNVIPFRVIVNYLHPHYHRIFMKAVMPIPAGTELCFNYGEDYIKRAGFHCQCGTIMCNSDTEKKRFWGSLTPTQIINTMFKIYRHYELVSKEREQLLVANKHLLEQRKGKRKRPAEKGDEPPTKKKRIKIPRQEADYLRLQNIQSGNIYGGEARKKKYRKDYKKHCIAACMEYSGIVDGKKEKERLEKIAAHNEQLRQGRRPMPAQRSLRELYDDDEMRRSEDSGDDVRHYPNFYARDPEEDVIVLDDELPIA